MAVAQWSGSLGTWTNRLAFTKPSFVYADMVLLSQSLESAIRTNYKQKLADTVTFYGWDVIDMRSFGAQEYVTPYAGAPGLDETEELPPSLSVVLTLRTLGRGRSYRGRVYAAGFAEDQMTNGVWLSLLTTEVYDQFLLFFESAQNIGWTQCIASCYINKVPRSEALMVPVTTMEVRSGIPGHQRRRDRRP